MWSDRVVRVVTVQTFRDIEGCQLSRVGTRRASLTFVFCSLIVPLFETTTRRQSGQARGEEDGRQDAVSAVLGQGSRRDAQSHLANPRELDLQARSEIPNRSRDCLADRTRRERPR